MSRAEAELLKAPYVLEYTFTRSTGPVIGRFLAGLRARRVLGIRSQSGRVIVPPQEYDPETGESLDELVEVKPTGTVKTWTWVEAPLPAQPLSRPFAWALIQLDGADTPLLHAVDAGSIEHMRTGLRVRARWAAERSGRIQDLACFEPIDGASETAADATPTAESLEPIGLLKTPVRLEYTVVAGHHLSEYLRGFQRKQIVGARCPSCQKVLLPPRGSCPTCGVPTQGLEQVADRGTVTTFCVIAIPFENAPFPPPYVAASILLDGADIPIMHLIRGVEPGNVRMGMRMRAIWRDEAELAPTLASIKWFEPSGEPDAEYDSYKEHL